MDLIFLQLVQNVDTTAKTRTEIKHILDFAKHHQNN